jgi:transcriptional regulator with XRE-family HTH domain
MVVVGEDISLQRRRRALTQTDLAVAVGVHQTHVSNIERGRTTDWATIIKICKELEIDHESLMKRAFGFESAVESDISDDPSLRSEDRGLLLTIYRELKRRGPFGEIATA